MSSTFQNRKSAIGFSITRTANKKQSEPPMRRFVERAVD